MSAQIFIDKLEASNLLDATVINKLRSKVAKPGKTPPAQSVAKYCLEKGYLTQAQADRLLESMAQELAQTGGADLGVAENASVISAADLVEDDLVEEIVDLQASPDVLAQPMQAVQPVASLDDPFAVPTAAPADPYGGELGSNGNGSGNGSGNGDGNGDSQSDSKKFSGKRKHEQSFESRWIVLGSASLVILLLLGWFFATVILKGNSDEEFREAEELFANESYPASVDAYKDFIKNFKSDPNAKYAHVKFRLAEMKIAATGKDVSNTIEVFETNIEKITLVMADQIDDPPFEDEIRKMIALDTVTSAQKAANAAANESTVEGKESALAKAKDMMRLVNDGKFVPRSERELPSFSSMIEATQATLNNVENSITQEKDTVAAIAEANTKIEAGETYDAFQVYDRLTTKHPSAEADGRVIKLVTAISDKEQSLARKLDSLAENWQDATDAVSAAVVGRVSVPTFTGNPFPDLDENVSAFLVNGSVYGVDIGKGKIIWRHFVGYETSINPVRLENPDRYLICDEKNHRIRLVDPATGDTVWHKTIGEPFLRPTVAGNKIFISMTSGKVARVDSESGELSAIVQLPQKLIVPATSNASGNVLYQVGEHLNLYVLSASLTEINCVQAYYLGHRDGMIRVPPVLHQGILILPVNIDAKTCELKLLTNVKDSMELKVAGESHELKSNMIKSPKVFGNYIATVTVNGDVEVLELDSNDQEFSLASVAKKKLNLPTTQEIFYEAAVGKLWIGTKGIVQYAVVVAKQKIQDEAVADNADFFVGQMKYHEGLLVHVRKRAGSRMVSISGVSPNTLNEVWRLDVGGGLAGAPLVNNESVVAVNSQGDFYRLDDANVASKIVHESIHRASTTQQNLVFSRSVGFPDGGGFIIGPQDRKDSISFVPSNSSLPVSLAELNINNLRITSDPIKFMNGVLIGLNNGEIRLVIPRATNEDAIFVPQAKVGDEFLWQRPCQLSADSFAVANHDGRIFSIKYVPNNGTPYLAQVLEAKAPRKIIGPMVNTGNLLFTLGDGPNGNDLLAIDPANLKIKGSYELGGISTWGPEELAGKALATTSDGTLLAFSTDITTPDWQAKLPHGRATGRPVSWNNKIVITLKDGKVVIVEPDGSSVKTIETGEPFSGQSSLAGNKLYASGADGSICVIDLSLAE